MLNDEKGRASGFHRELMASVYRGNRLLFVINTVLYLLNYSMELAFAYILKLIIDAASALSLEDLVHALIYLVIATAAQFACGLALRKTTPLFLRRAVAQYRETAFGRLFEKGIGAFEEGGTSRYVSALTNDVAAMETDYLGKLFVLITLVFVFFGAIIMLFMQSVILTLVAIAAALLPFAASILAGDRLAQRQREVSDRNEKFVASLKDMVSGFSIIKSFRAERQAVERLTRSNRSLEESKRSQRMTERSIRLLGNLSFSMSQNIVMIFGAWLCVTDRGTTIGTIMMALQLMSFIAKPLEEMPPILAARRATYELVGKLAAALEDNKEEGGAAQLPTPLVKGMHMDAVTFAYEAGAPVLRGFTADFPAGGCYALVGASGSGKSTLLSLLMGTRSDYEGSIFYDNVELHEVSRASLYETVSLVRQDTFLFDATLRENVTMFRDVAEEDLGSAVGRAGLGTFVEEHGLDYPCGEGGANLSGGERQRVCIARSLLAGADVLLLDEATSALDQKTADQVTRSVLALAGTTRIVVTHRLDGALLSLFDGILVLRDGRVCEQGSFDELMSKDGYFRALYTVSDDG